MLAYAANNRPAGRAGSPKALTLILVGHAAVLAAVLTAKMEGVSPFIPEPPPIVISIPNDPPPPRVRPQPQPERDPATSNPYRPTPQVDLPPFTNVPIADGPPTKVVIPEGGTGPGPITLDPHKPAPFRIAARFATPDSALKPPYPLDKRRLEEEAKLTLRLSIDARGRVTAVEPVGAADPSFLEAARRHIIRAWRYKPATEDGVAMPSSTVITMSFRLEDV